MITLVNPPGLKSFSGLQMHVPNPPIGLAYLAASIKDAGYDYCVIDGTGEALDEIHTYPGRDDFLMQGLALEQIVERIPSGTRIIGMGCMFSTLWPITRMLAERVRATLPDVVMVLGGEHGTAVFEHVLRTSPFDVVVLGEGEETFINLIKAVKSNTPLAEVQGIAFRDQDEVVDTGLSSRRRDVDAIPPPDWDSIPLDRYISRHQMNGVNLGRSMPLLATRGCPYQCTFCSNPFMWTQRWVARDPKLVVDEIERYVKRYDVSNFDFQDLTAVIKRRWVIAFCKELKARNLNITWQMPSGTRAETFDEEVAGLLYESGCRALAFAPESGSEEMLKIVKKQVDLAKMMESVRIALRHDLTLSCFFVIGFPEESKETLGQTLSLIRRLAVLGIHDVSVAKFVPYPGSELFRRLQDEGRIKLDDEFFESPMDFYTTHSPSYADQISTRRLYWTMIWMFVNFYVISFAVRPLRVVRVLFNAVFRGREETRYSKWFVDRIYTRRQWRKLHQTGDRARNPIAERGRQHRTEAASP